MGKRTAVPTVNAGSMADIAFLLLIFFLVTTTIETDAGLDRMLPNTNLVPPLVQKERNVLEISINKENELMIDGHPLNLFELRETAIRFIDNGGEPEKCNYCKGRRSPESSEHPLIAIISVKNDRETTYETYIGVQNELVAAYHALRNREGQSLYQQDYTAMEAAYTDSRTDENTKIILKGCIKQLQEMYPLNIIEPIN
ncbi:biopolymer transporter ExbD [Aggregatimonas sangjinii]|uniref:Biopolymer transporter ExbD n=1 Tax=Aggregatimonas sangjinii TaxID=2583587 RepID=A0A5B7SX05_9FLAO|nr:biopolymer transporter ExbD [Aggregatimonas sangjinii]QCX01264.1 biopolymer transporter ExbD [Aggregatimonas sangjinii]